MDFINEGKTGKVKLQDIFDNIYEDCDSALADDFYKGLKSKMDSEDNINLADAEVQLYIRDFLESHENDYQYDLLKQALEPYYDHEYDLADEDVQESYEVLEEDDSLEENATFEEIIYRMECAEIYEDLYNAAMLIVDPKLQNEVTKLIQQCEDDGDDVEEAYSIVTSDLLDMHINDKNVENLDEDKKIKTEAVSFIDFAKVQLNYEALDKKLLEDIEQILMKKLGEDWYKKSDKDIKEVVYNKVKNDDADKYYNMILKYKDYLKVDYTLLPDTKFKSKEKEVKTEVKKTLNDVYSDSATESLWDEKFKELVPKEGKAETTIGEIMRCFASMSYAYLQNGEIINNMQQYYLDKVWELDDILKDFGDSTLSSLLDKMYNTRSKSAYDHYMAEFYEYFVNTYLKGNKEVKEESEENPQEFEYRMLARLKSDCDYYLGNGNRNAEHSLWAKNEDGQIAKMREIYNQLKEKPEWLSEEDINNYAKEMGVVDLPSTTDGTAEKEIQDMVDRSEKRSKENLDESRDSFDREELVAVKNSIDTALNDLQITSNGTTGAMEDKVLVNDLRNVSQSVGSYLNRVNESKDIKEEASKLPPDFKVDFEGDMTVDMGYTNEEGAEKRAKELLGDVAKSTNVRDLNVDVKDVKRIERENKTLTESEEKFSGVEFEKNIPHVMRYKQYDVSENENGETLYWVTQQFFTLEELKQFQKAFISELANDKFGFTEAYVTVRDLSTYDLKEDYENGVLCYITKYDLDYEGYEEFCKEYNFDLNKGWLEESKELKKENKVIWTSEYQGDETTADEAYQEYIDEFEPSPKTPKDFEDWLQDTFDIWLDAEADNYNKEHPGEIDKLSDYEIDAIDQELRDKVQKEIEANMDDLKDQYEEYCEEIQKEMTSPEDKERWQTGWYEQDAEAQWEVMDEDFSDNIWPMIENQCNEDILILLGSVGRWNGTFDGGKIIYADEKNLRNTMSDYDEISVEADDENKLSINYMHHDGTDTMYLYTIPQDLTELAKAMEYEDPDELDTDIRQDYVDIEELAKHVDLLVPIINKGRGNV